MHIISNIKFKILGILLISKWTNLPSYISWVFKKKILISAIKLLPLTSVPSLDFPLSLSNNMSVAHFLCPMPDQGVGSHSEEWQKKLPCLRCNISLLREAFSFTSPFSDHKTCSGLKDKEVHCSTALFCFLHKSQKHLLTWPHIVAGWSYRLLSFNFFTRLLWMSNLWWRSCFFSLNYPQVLKKIFMSHVFATNCTWPQKSFITSYMKILK